MLGSKDKLETKWELAPDNSVSKHIENQYSFISGVEINYGTDKLLDLMIFDESFSSNGSYKPLFDCQRLSNWRDEVPFKVQNKENIPNNKP